MSSQRSAGEIQEVVNKLVLDPSEETEPFRQLMLNAVLIEVLVDIRDALNKKS